MLLNIYVLSRNLVKYTACSILTELKIFHFLFSQNSFILSLSQGSLLKDVSFNYFLCIMPELGIIHTEAHLMTPFQCQKKTLK